MTAGKIIQHIFLTQHKNTLFFVKQFPLDNAIHKKKKKTGDNFNSSIFSFTKLKPVLFLSIKTKSDNTLQDNISNKQKM